MTPVETLIDGLSEPLLLLLAALAGLVETVFPPFPSETVLLAIAFAAARKRVSVPQLILAATLGSFLSLYGLYLLGRGPFRNRLGRRIRSWSASFDDTIRAFFDRYGYGAVFVSRFLPAVRGPLTFIAGVYGLRSRPTALALFAGCLVWSTIIILIGLRAGAAWDGSSGSLVLVGLGMGGAILVLWGLGIGIRRVMERASAARRG